MEFFRPFVYAAPIHQMSVWPKEKRQRGWSISLQTIWSTNKYSQLKLKFALKLKKRAQETISTCATYIKESSALCKIACNGSPPSLDGLTETQIRVVCYLALNSVFINRLDSSHPLYFVKVAEQIDTKAFFKMQTQMSLSPSPRQTNRRRLFWCWWTVKFAHDDIIRCVWQWTDFRAAYRTDF